MKKHSQLISIYIYLAIGSLIGIMIIKDYIVSVILGSFFAIITYPLYLLFLKLTTKFQNVKSLLSRILKIKSSTLIHENKTLSSVFTVFTTFLIVVISLYTIGLFAGNSLKTVIDQPIEEGISIIIANPSLKQNFGSFYNEADVNNTVSQYLKQFETTNILKTEGTKILSNNETRNTISRFVNGFFANLITFFIYLLIMLFSWVVMLINGKDILKFLYKYTFLRTEEQNIINKDVTTAVRNIITGNIVSGILISLAVTLLCLYFKIPLVIVWAIFAFFIGFLPLSPSELAYLPVIVGVFFTAGPTTALITAILIELYIFILNNAILPKITAGKEINPLLILMSVFAAITIFGFAGFVIGPVFAYLMMALFKISNTRFDQYTSSLEYLDNQKAL